MQPIFPTSLVAGLGTALFLSLTATLAPAQDQADAPSVRVVVAAAQTKELTDEVTFIGRGRAIDSAEIVARVNGYLQEVQIENGSEVKKGQLLYRIEPDFYEATLAARTAELSQAEANLELAVVEEGRKQELVQRGATPQSEEDVAKANKLVAEAQVKSAQAAIRSAQLDLSYTEIYAPFSGRVGTTAFSIGELVGPQTGALVILVREQPIQVEFSVTEKQLLNVAEKVQEDVAKLADSAKTPDVYVTLPNGSELEEPGKIVFVDNRIDPTTGTIALRAEFANERRLIIDGSFMDVTIEAVDKVSRLLIPQAAVQRDQRGDFVLVVTSNALVEQRYVTLGGQHETDRIVVDGMREGEVVIIEGLQKVRPGAKVETVTAGSTPGE